MLGHGIYFTRDNVKAKLHGDSIIVAELDIGKAVIIDKKRSSYSKNMAESRIFVRTRSKELRHDCKWI